MHHLTAGAYSAIAADIVKKSEVICSEKVDTSQEADTVVMPVTCNLSCGEPCEDRVEVPSAIEVAGEPPTPS